jgi:hypothetical protein
LVQKAGSNAKAKGDVRLRIVTRALTALEAGVDAVKAAADAAVDSAKHAKDAVVDKVCWCCGGVKFGTMNQVFVVVGG